MRILCFIVLAIGAHLAFAQSGTLSTESLAGCYRLQVLGWHVLSEANMRLPRRFILATQPYPHSGSRFVARNLDLKVQWDLPLSSWSAKDDDTLQITWSTGFVGYDVQVIKSGSEFRGLAHYFTDTDANLSPTLTPSNSLSVVIRRADCQDTTK
jgi:hypothetical protein